MVKRYSTRLLYEVEFKRDGKLQTSYYLLKRIVENGWFSSSIKGRLWQECNSEGIPRNRFGLPKMICYSPEDVSELVQHLKNGGILEEELKKSESQTSIDYEEQSGHLIQLKRNKDKKIVPVPIGRVKSVTDISYIL